MEREDNALPAEREGDDSPIESPSAYLPESYDPDYSPPYSPTSPPVSSSPGEGLIK
jgi:hypothetical protein